MAGNFSVTVEVPNLLAVQARLEELGVVKVPAAMRKVIVAGAKPMKAAILAETPMAKPGTVSVQSESFPGDLRRGVRYKSGRTTKALASIAGAHQALAYYMVGPMGHGTAHRHLVIAGHEIVGHAPNLTHTGKQTTPNPFVERGRKAGEGPAVAAIEAAAKVALAEAERL